MTTFALNQMEHRLEELAELTRVAWGQYSGAVRDLEGREYEEAERISWAELQATLRAIGAERDALTGVASPAA